MADDRPIDDYAKARDAFMALRNEPPSSRERLLNLLDRTDPALAPVVRRMIDRSCSDASASPRPELNGGMAPGDPSPVEDGRSIASLISDAVTLARQDSNRTNSNARSLALPSIDDRYRVLERIGAGGVGDVYLAEQVNPVKRRVAIKVFRGRDVGDASSQRFEREARVLARMDHPDIARVTDAGMTTEGLRFLAMEFVDGQPIDRACEALRLGAKDRISLVIDVCGAVEHAHSRGVIHRDLKPSNILVVAPGSPDRTDGRSTAPPGESPRREPSVAIRSKASVKVIDFGIARLLDADATGEMTLTLEGQLFGTLAYMSPEQLAGAPADVRSDVYALGVILHQLLTERKPSIGHRFDAADRARRVELAQSPLSPVPRRRDLEAIVERAVAVDPAARYATPAALADDLRALLADRPVRARPARAIERFRLAARRAPFTTATVVLAAAAAIVAIAAVLHSRAALSEQRGLQRREVVLLLDEVLTTLNPLMGATGPRKALATTLMARTEAMLAIDPDDPGLLEARARLLLELGGIEGELANSRDGLRLRARAMNEFAALVEREPDDLRLRRRHAEAIVLHADLLYHLERRDEALIGYRRAFETLEWAHRRAPDDISLMDDLSWAYDRIWTEDELKKEPDRVLALIGRRLALGERLVEVAPERSLSHYSQMEGHRRLGYALRLVGRAQEGHEHLVRAVAIGTRLVEREPRRFHFRVHLGHTLINAAAAAQSAGLDAEELDHLVAADRLSASLLDAEPDRIDSIILRISERKAWISRHDRRGDTIARDIAMNDFHALIVRMEHLEAVPTSETLDARRRLFPRESP